MTINSKHTDFSEFTLRLEKQLQNGWTVKGHTSDMMPEGRVTIPDVEKPPRKSAVLILFYKNGKDVYFPLIRRPKYDGAHSGQMALPGGKYEEGDRTLVQTALRESCEEIGICKTGIRVIGELSELFIPVTNMLVLPVVAFANFAPVFYIDEREVETLYKINVNEFLDGKVKRKETWNLRGNQVQVPFYLLQEQKVWGATAMILSELEMLLKGLKSGV